jgi:MFS family permease
VDGGPGAGTAPGAARSYAQILRLPSAQLALAAMLAGQMVMVAVMVITPLHMTHLNHDLRAVSWVIGAHVVGMYALSVLVGRLADRYGRPATIVLGASLLLTSCVLAPASHNTAALGLSLFLLGLGWSCCYVAGSSLLTDLLRPGERARIQGANDLAVGFLSAGSSLGSGLAFAALGYGGMATAGIIVAGSLFGFVLLRRRQPVAGALSPS